jgi:phosphohistidine phosphatase
MELLLWRHATAEDGIPDALRELTPYGKEQAQRVALWLREHAPHDARLLVSPALRTQQTAAFFREQMELCAELAGFSADKILALLDWPNAKTPIIVVGHQPTLGEIVAQLLEDHRYLNKVHKGSLWWLSGKPGTKTELHQHLDPADVGADGNP